MVLDQAVATIYGGQFLKYFLIVVKIIFSLRSLEIVRVSLITF